MSFYEPEIFTSQEEIDALKASRFLQPFYDFVKNGNEDILRSPLFGGTLGVSAFFVISTVFTLVDLIFGDSKLIRQYKLQKSKKTTLSLIGNSLVNAFWNHILLIIPLNTVSMIWVPPTPLPPVAPTVFSFCWQMAAWLVIFDAYYFSFHVLEHKWRWLFRWCHSIHHQYSSPFALMTEYLHPFEIFAVGAAIAMIPWLFTPHCFTYWCWLVLANYISIEAHCGYNFPWALNNWIKFYGGAPHHDLHHMRPLTNFQPWFNWFDRLFGWNITLEEINKNKESKRGIHSDEDWNGLVRQN